MRLRELITGNSCCLRMLSVCFLIYNILSSPYFFSEQVFLVFLFSIYAIPFFICQLTDIKTGKWFIENFQFITLPFEIICSIMQIAYSNNPLSISENRFLIMDSHPHFILQISDKVEKYRGRVIEFKKVFTILVLPQHQPRVWLEINLN